MGVSLKNLPEMTNIGELKFLIETYKNKNYMLVPDLHKRTIYVALVKDETADDVIVAYFHAVMLAITLCLYNKIPMVSVHLLFIHLKSGRSIFEFAEC